MPTSNKRVKQCNPREPIITYDRHDAIPRDVAIILVTTNGLHCCFGNCCMQIARHVLRT